MKKLLNHKSNDKKRLLVEINHIEEKILNESEVINLLKKYNFKTIYAEKISFNNQQIIFINKLCGWLTWCWFK